MSRLEVGPSGVRRRSRRTRRSGRGRGPLVLPGPLSPGVPRRTQTPRQAFDDLALGLVERLTERWPSELGTVEFGVEDVPRLPDRWADEPVPLGALTRAEDGQPARIVVFRRPIQLRTRSRLEQVALVNEVLVEHIADLLGREPGEIDP